MADIANLITQQIDRDAGRGVQIQQQGQAMLASAESAYNTRLKDKIATTELQNNIDGKAQALMQTADFLNGEVSKAKNIITQLMEMSPGAGKENPEIQSALEKAQVTYEHAVNKRDGYVQALTDSPQMIATLMQSSYANDDIENKIIKDSLETMNQTDKQKLIDKLTIITAAEMDRKAAAAEASQQAEIKLASKKAYATERGKLMARGESEQDLLIFPSSRGLSFDVYAGTMEGRESLDEIGFNEPVTKEEAQRWYREDLTPFIARTEELKTLQSDVKSKLANTLDIWKTFDIKKFSDREARKAIKGMKEEFNKIDWPENISSIEYDVINTIGEILENNDPSRINGFLEVLKPYINPTKKTSIQVRSAEGL